MKLVPANIKPNDWSEASPGPHRLYGLRGQG
jgi:hypothetical protein